MGLDVSLNEPEHQECDHCGGTGKISGKNLFWANITHNLNEMANEAGIYEACWRPGEIGISKAKNLIPLLRDGLEKMRADPERFKRFNAPNGWGTYETFVEWVAGYLRACEEFPDAEVVACG